MNNKSIEIYFPEFYLYSIILFFDKIKLFVILKKELRLSEKLLSLHA